MTDASEVKDICMQRRTGYLRLSAGLRAAGLASGFASSHFERVKLWWVKLEKLVVEMGARGGGVCKVVAWMGVDEMDEEERSSVGGGATLLIRPARGVLWCARSTSPTSARRLRCG